MKLKGKGESLGIAVKIKGWIMKRAENEGLLESNGVQQFQHS